MSDFYYAHFSYCLLYKNVVVLMLLQHISLSTLRIIFPLFFSVDLVDMDNVVTKAFDQHGLRTNNENLIDVGEIISVLLTIFENVEKTRKVAISVLQCVDMTLNWLLNVFDR